jgi:hypothetical protein
LDPASKRHQNQDIKPALVSHWRYPMKIANDLQNLDHAPMQRR